MKELTALWNRSVRTTHHFLTEQDILNLQPVVEQAIVNIPRLIVATCEGMDCCGTPVGFIGVARDKIEMLFVTPEFIGKGGGGHRLLDWATRECDARRIDVNKQNENAAAVYRHWGFKAYERTETDEQGNHFPILKMRLE